MDIVLPAASEHVSYKKRFPAHHRRRNQVQREHERRTSREIGNGASSGEPAVPRPAAAGLGILDWADSVLEELNNSNDWGQRKKHIRHHHRRYRSRCSLAQYKRLYDSLLT